jgi:hypothetical protein
MAAYAPRRSHQDWGPAEAGFGHGQCMVVIAVDDDQWGSAKPHQQCDAGPAVDVEQILGLPPRQTPAPGGDAPDHAFDRFPVILRCWQDGQAEVVKLQRMSESGTCAAAGWVELVKSSDVRQRRSRSQKKRRRTALVPASRSGVCIRTQSECRHCDLPVVVGPEPAATSAIGIGAAPGA